MTLPSSYFGSSLTDLLRQAMAEDEGDGDHTSLSTIPSDLQGEGLVRVKQDGILAGITVAQTVAALTDPTIRCDASANDGAAVVSGQVVLSLKEICAPCCAPNDCCSTACSA